MSKHTKGPWEYWSAMTKGVHDKIVSSNVIVAVIKNNLDPSDAHLIAAAPELLEALEELLEAYSRPDERICCDGGHCGCMGATAYQLAERDARAAIAKAKGEGQ